MATSTTEDTCSICLNPLIQQGLDIFTTACQHRFHFQCLVKNVQAQNNECPLCRTTIDSLVDLVNASANPVTPSPTLPVPTKIVTPIQPSAPTNGRGAWHTLRTSLSNAFRWITNSNRPSSPNYDTHRPTSRFSLRSACVDDPIDETAARNLSDRISAARRQCAESLAENSLITVTTTLEFGGQESTKESNIYGMITLKAPSAFASTTSEKDLDELHVPIDLVCVVDQSGSMGGEKIALLKETLAYITDQMGALDRLGIISFNTTAFNRSNGLKLMTNEKKQTLRNTITNDIKAGGGTFIGSGLEMAIDLLRHRRTMNPVGALLLLTDGQDNQHHDYSTLMASLPENVVCHTFGYGLDHNVNLLSRVAEEGHGGIFTYIDRFDGIGPAFATALGGIFTCVAKQLRIVAEFRDNYRVTAIHTMYPYESTPLPAPKVTFKLTDLNADEKRNLVFQLHVPRLDPSHQNEDDEHTIGHATLEYIDANTGRAIQIPSVPFILARPSQISPTSPLLQVNYVLDVQRNRAETSHVLKQAVEEQDYQRARELITAQIAKIRSSVSAQDPLCQQLIQDLEQQYQDRREFVSILKNMSLQHGQERATYSTNKTISSTCYVTSGQERYRSKFH